MPKHPRGEMPENQNICMTLEMKDDLFEAAHVARVTPSEYIRRLLDDALYPTKPAGCGPTFQGPTS